MYQIHDFTQQVALAARKWGHKHYSGISAELTAIAAGLSADPTVHDLTIEKPPAATRIDHKAQTAFTNEVLLVVNRGKGGGLTNAAMAAAITSALPSDLPPVNTTAPIVTGTGTVGQNLTTSNGVWTNAPASYLYQWLRGGAQIAGATNAVYALIGTDSGNPVSCRVTALNAAGNASALSNAIAVA